MKMRSKLFTPTCTCTAGKPVVQAFDDVRRLDTSKVLWDVCRDHEVNIKRCWVELMCGRLFPAITDVFEILMHTSKG